MPPKAKAPAPKAATPAPKAEVASMAAPAAKPRASPAGEFATLEDKKKFVLKHEVKIDDAAELVKDEPNRNKKKELEDAIEEAISWLDANQSAEKEEYEEKQKAMEKVVNPIFSSLYQEGGGGGGEGGDSAGDDDEESQDRKSVV